jgi:CHAD domain-containing protein
VKARKIAGLDPAAPLSPNARRIVATRLEELHFLAEEALVPDAAEAQHDMRIAAKRLRYALEIVGPCIGEPAEPARLAAKELQSALGDLHDCDVIMPQIEAIPSLADAIRERREHLFGAFAELWRDETIRDAWAALKKAL